MKKAITMIMSEKCTAGCAETHSQDITWIHGFPHGTSKDNRSRSVGLCCFSFFFSHLKLHRDPKRTCSVEVELACFNISLEVSGTHTQVSVSKKQRSEFALWLNQKRVLRFSHFCHRHSQTLFTQPDKTMLSISRHYGSIHVHCDL